MRARPGAVSLGVVVAGLAWLIGSTALWVLGIGLALAFGLSDLWALAVRRNLAVERQPPATTPIEGDPVALEARVRGRRLLAARIEWRDRVGALGEQVVDVPRGGRSRIVLASAPRGRYPLGPGRLVVDDPLGLARIEVPVPSETSLVVRPRVPELPTLFTDTGSWGDGGRRAGVRRQSGLEPHGVRDYVEGEPLRAVHWPTSARRGELMVRELEDAPRDSVAVVLDADAGSHAGPRGASSLDEAVRIAGGLLRAYASRARRSLLVVAASRPLLLRVHALGRDWEEALDALASVEPDDRAPLGQLLAPRATAGSIPEVVVVTSRPAVAADALVGRVAGGHASALVHVDAATYAGRPPSGHAAALARLAGAGVALAVVHKGDALPEALGALRRGGASAHG